MALLLRVHRGKKGIVLAICDAELLGKRFEEEDKVLDVAEKFYGGRPAEIEEIKTKFEKASSANVVGNTAVGALVSAGIIDADGVKAVSGIKYAFWFRL